LDGGGGMYWGNIASVSADGLNLTLSDDPKPHDYSPHMLPDFEGAFVGVLAGKGAGTYSRVASNRGRNLSLTGPLSVTPDQTSELSVVPFRGDYLFVGNRFEEGGAVQLYGIAVRCILAWNVGSRFSGFSAWGRNLRGWGWQPNVHIQFLGNKIEVGNAWGGTRGTFASITSDEKAGNFTGPLNRGLIFRGNVANSDAYIALGGTLKDAVCEHNLVRDSDRGIVVANTTAGVMLRDNRFENVPANAQIVNADWQFSQSCSNCQKTDELTGVAYPLDKPETYWRCCFAAGRHHYRINGDLEIV